MNELVERLMDMLWARGVTVTASDVEAVIALIQDDLPKVVDYSSDPDVALATVSDAAAIIATLQNEMPKVGDYYADPDIGPSIIA